MSSPCSVCGGKVINPWPKEFGPFCKDCKAPHDNVVEVKPNEKWTVGNLKAVDYPIAKMTDKDDISDT